MDTTRNPVFGQILRAHILCFGTFCAAHVLARTLRCSKATRLDFNSKFGFLETP